MCYFISEPCIYFFFLSVWQEALQKRVEIQKKKQELLQKSIEQQKVGNIPEMLGKGMTNGSCTQYRMRDLS